MVGIDTCKTGWRVCTGCTILSVCASGVFLASVIASQLKSGKGQLFSSRTDAWCHVLSTRPISINGVNLSYNVNLVNIQLPTINLGSLVYNQNSKNYVEATGLLQQPTLRCSPTGRVLDEDKFQISTFMESNWDLLMFVALGGWTLVVLIKICLLQTYLRVIRTRGYTCCWTAFVAVDAYLHITLLPMLLLLPLTSLSEIPDLPGMFTLNVNWHYWVAVLCIVMLAFLRWIVYLLCPCTKATCPDCPKIPHCHTGLACFTLITIAFLLFSVFDFGLNIGWSAVFLIDLAIVLKFEFSVGVGMFSSIFQKLVFLNLITMNIMWCCNFASMLCGSDDAGSEDDEESFNDGYGYGNESYYDTDDESCCFGGPSSPIVSNERYDEYDVYNGRYDYRY